MERRLSFADAYPPRQIALKVEELGVAKAASDALTMGVLAVLAGAFISLGALFFTVVITHASFGFGVNRLLGGIAFCLGLILVVVAGAELFTGNNLVAMAWASRRVSTAGVVRNWVIVYVGNVVGCFATVMLVLWGDIAGLGGGAVRETAVNIASVKAGLSVGEAFARGILCNALVCLAVWLAMGGRTVTDKIMAILFPIAAFVTVGFEHSIANWFFLPYGIALDGEGVVSLAGAVRNLTSVSLGNILGGTVLVAGVYWVAYLRQERGPEAK
jgi:formate/nitrite transporter